jgi:hypothetical protein
LNKPMTEQGFRWSNTGKKPDGRKRKSESRRKAGLRKYIPLFHFYRLTFPLFC